MLKNLAQVPCMKNVIQVHTSVLYKKYSCTARCARVPMPAQPSSSVSDRLHTSFGHCFLPTPAFSQQPSSLHSTLPAQHVRPSCFFGCWSDGLELIARRHAGSGVFCGQLQTVTKDIFIFAVVVCSGH